MRRVRRTTGTGASGEMRLDFAPQVGIEHQVARDKNSTTAEPLLDRLSDRTGRLKHKRNSTFCSEIVKASSRVKWEHHTVPPDL